MLDGAQYPVRLAERPDLPHLFRRQQVHLDADRLGDAGIVQVLVPAITGPGKTDIGDLGETDIHARLFLQFLVEAVSILVRLTAGLGQVEQLQQTGGMPGGARRQSLPLDKTNIETAYPGEIVERSNAS